MSQKIKINFDLFRIHEDHPIMSFTISKDGRLALLNIATQVRIYYFFFYRFLFLF